LPAGLALEVDGLCDDFERLWRRSQRRGMPLPIIDSFIARVSPGGQAALKQCLGELERELSAGIVLPHVPGLRIEEEIGRGGMGVVYRARRAEGGQPVALKLIPGAEHARWSRWIAELADLRHPNLVPLETFGTHDGLHFVVMPLVDGGDLKERIGDFMAGPGNNVTALRHVAGMMAKVAGAVDFLHRRGILHRDLKPSNILLRGAGNEPLVCDFGLAGRLDEATAGIVGTPAYMAPEQREGRPLSPAADVWSLGALLCELVTGRVPCATDDPLSSVQEPLQRICRRCLELDPEARYATAGELADELRCYLDESTSNGETHDRHAK
jgi:serine/threonine protein kinase